VLAYSSAPTISRPNRWWGGLAADRGLRPIDCGGLANERLIAGAVDVLRFQLVAAGSVPFLSLGINVVEDA
jgi:hypothetical protein